MIRILKPCLTLLLLLLLLLVVVVAVVMVVAAGRKPSRGRIQRRHHVSDGPLRKVVGTVRLVTRTDCRRGFRRNVRLVRATLLLIRL